MITGELKSKVDRIWDTMWSGGISNPLSVIEQLTYLLFIKRLAELQTLKEAKAARTGKPIEDPIFKKRRTSSAGRASRKPPPRRCSRRCSRRSSPSSSPSAPRVCDSGCRESDRHLRQWRTREGAATPEGSRSDRCRASAGRTRIAPLWPSSCWHVDDRAGNCEGVLRWTLTANRCGYPAPIRFF